MTTAISIPTSTPTAQTFSSLNEEYKSIMKPYFGSENFLLFKYYSPRYDGINFRGSIYQQINRGSGAPTQNGGSCTVEYEKDFLNAKAKLRTTGDIHLGFNVELGKYVKNLSSKIKLNSNYLSNTYGGKLNFLYSKERVSTKLTLDWDEHKSLSAKVLGIIINKPNQQLGLGAGTAFAFEDKQFSIYNVSLWYVRNYSRFLLMHKTPRNKFGLGDLVGKIYNRIDDRTDFALGFCHSFVDRNDLISLGLRYRHSDAFTLKTKVDSTLNLKAAFELVLGKNLKLVITSNYHLSETPTGKESFTEILPPISLRIAIGEI